MSKHQCGGHVAHWATSLHSTESSEVIVPKLFREAQLLLGDAP